LGWKGASVLYYVKLLWWEIGVVYLFIILIIQMHEMFNSSGRARGAIHWRGFQNQNATVSK